MVLDGLLPAYLAVGGGCEDQLIVYATLDGRSYLHLVGDEHAEGETVVCVGGQEIEYERRFMVDRTSAISAATVFAENGSLGGRFLPQQASSVSRK